MKWNRRIAALLIALIAALGAACRAPLPGSEASYEKIQKRLVQLKGYKAEGSVTYKSNKNSHTYDITQYAKSSGEYRIEVTGPANVAGNTTVFDGKTIAQYNERVQGRVVLGATDAQERYEILITSFVRNYVKSQEVSVTAAAMDESVCTVLEAVIPGGNPFMASEKLWVDNATLTPVKLVIFDPSGAERVIVTFTAFDYNANLADSLFEVK